MDLRIAATVLLNFYEGDRLPLYARSMKTIQSVLFKNPFYVVGITVGAEYLLVISASTGASNSLVKMFTFTLQDLA